MDHGERDLAEERFPGKPKHDSRIFADGPKQGQFFVAAVGLPDQEDRPVLEIFYVVQGKSLYQVRSIDPDSNDASFVKIAYNIVLLEIFYLFADLMGK